MKTCKCGATDDAVPFRTDRPMCLECHRAMKRTWYQANREKCKSDRIKWNQANPEKHFKQRTSARARYQYLQSSAKARQIPMLLTFEEFAIFLNQPCIYCDNQLGHKVVYGSGLDRLDNDRGYEVGNVQSCCKDCNSVRGDILSVEETKAAIKAVIEVRNK